MMKLFANLLRPDREQWQRLADILRISESDVRQLKSDRRLSYRPFQIRHRSGRPRRILAPSAFLRQLQRQLLSGYLERFPTHRAATAFGRGCSVMKHAGVHVGREMILTADLKDFFESTQRKRVRQWFREQDWSGDCLETLVWLTCFRNGLPQGAPTSPALSNLINITLDEQLQEASTCTAALYSRYCDDLAFSWNRADEPRGFRDTVDSIIRRFSYQLQPEKGWQLQYACQDPKVTGVIIHGRKLRPSF